MFVKKSMKTVILHGIEFHLRRLNMNLKKKDLVIFYYSQYVILSCFSNFNYVCK
jgi:hypothetical protein